MPISDVRIFLNKTMKNSPRKTLPLPPPRNGEGESLKPLPALSGKGDGGLGRKPLPQPLPGTERREVSNKRRGKSQTTPPALSGKGDGGLYQFAIKK